MNNNLIKGLGFIALAAALGYAKRDKNKKKFKKTLKFGSEEYIKRKFVAPVQEESTFNALGTGVLRAAAFAGAHIASEMSSHTLESGVTRAADTFIGGLLYGAATKELGLLGGIAAHIAHNLATDD